MKTNNKLILVISDLHVGSTVGLWPSNFHSNEGNPIGQNQFQKWLWKCWMDANQWVSKITKGEPYDIVVNGDIVDGIHHKTLQVMTPDLGDQISAVRHILSGIMKDNTSLHIIKGTESHTLNQEIAVGRALGASKNKANGQHAWDNLDLEMNGKLYNFAHHISATARTYLEASAHSIMLGNLTHARARTKKRVPDVMIRAHRHRHGIWQDGNQISAITGAWQGLTRYGYKVVPDAIPQPSVIIFDARNQDKDELPLIHSRVYTAE